MIRRTTVPILLACAFALLAPPALGDYVGLEVVERTDLTICQANEPEIPFKLEVCEIYVVFDNSGDRLISTAFTNVSTTDPAGFYQHTLGSNTAPACNLIPLFPTLVCDSFVTLGLECGGGGSTTDPDFDSTAFNNSGTVSGGWYNSAPSNGQGAPDADNRVLIARFSYKQNKTSMGNACIFAKLAGSNDIVEFTLQPFDCSLPNGGLPSGGGGPNPGCFEASGSCREVHGTAGCDCPECCEAVCDLDPSCCDVSWTQACVDLACAECDLEACGECAGATGSCYQANQTPGCDCQECCNLICCIDPFCCDPTPERGWTSPCAQAANDPDTGCPPACNATTQAIIYVDGDNQNQTQNGLSWATAFNDLQDALDLAGCCDSSVEQVWVAKATNPYLPDRGTGDRTETFRMTSGVQILGGFPPGGGDLVDRLPDTHVTILSGDIGTPGDNSDNSYHVVVAYAVDGTAVLDGFTITKGQADGAGLGDQGSGVHIFGVPPGTSSTPKLVNCTFLQNWVDNHGTVNDHGGATLKDCVFRENYSADFAAGLYVHDDIATTVTNCDFYDNTAVSEGGGAYVKIDSDPSDGPDPTFTNCTFSGNRANRGGGMYCGVARSPTLTNCTFTDNRATRLYGGAMYIDVSSAPTVSDCTFSNNSSTAGGLSYGGTVYNLGASPIFSNCMFLGGSADRYGAAIASQGTDLGVPLVEAHPQMINCTFIGNEVGNFPQDALGGAIFADRDGSVTLTNCLFVGNHNWNDEGGAVGILGPTRLIATNCTFIANSATTFGGGIFIAVASSVDAEVHNCIFWENTDNGGAKDDESAQIHFTGAIPSVTYGDIMNLVQGGDFDSGPNIGNIGVLPMFVDPLSRTWTADGEYCSLACMDDPACDFCDGLELGQTKFTDTGASFPTPPNGDLVGRILNPNTTQGRVSLIAANTSTTVTVWGDLTGLENQTDLYQIDDYHLKSGSPCIDAATNLEVPDDVADLDNDGDTGEATPVDLDPKPRFIDDPTNPPGEDPGVNSPEHPEAIADMGAYEFAPDCGTCPTDVDDSGDTGPFDLAFLLGSWGEPITEADALCLDANEDLRIGSFDLAFLLGNWGPCP